MRELQNAPDFELQVLVIGSHWSPRHGMSVEAIRKDGFPISGEVGDFVEGDSHLEVLQMMGASLPKIGGELKRLDPHLVILLGDRTEIFAAATACHIMRIPFAHVAGGDVTSGAIDDALRHGITKMAALHFVTNDAARSRVIQLGESQESVYLTGSTAIETLKKVPPLSRGETLLSIGLEGRRPYLLVTYHPETLSLSETRDDTNEVARALHQLIPIFDIVITSPNEDPGFKVIASAVKTIAREQPAAVAVIDSAGTDLYVNLLRHAAACVGNSSSGLYEAPSVLTPTVNIGERQAGRVRARSVVDCPAVAEDIVEAVSRAMQIKMSDVSNPYDHGDASAKILQVLTSMPPVSSALPKYFCDRP